VSRKHFSQIKKLEQSGHVTMLTLT